MIAVQVLATIGSLASLIGAVFAVRPPGQPLSTTHQVLIGLGIILTTVALYSQAKGFWANRPIRLATDAQIRDYMYRWISRGGRVAIFSRDMSWVRDDDMKNLLKEKSRKNELDLCLPNRIGLSDELEREGAHIHVYPQLNYTPQSRFTIINKGRMDAQVAVGRRIGEQHVIEEFSVGQHPTFFIADDLVEIVMRLSQSSRPAAARK